MAGPPPQLKEIDFDDLFSAEMPEMGRTWQETIAMNKAIKPGASTSKAQTECSSPIGWKHQPEQMNALRYGVKLPNLSAPVTSANHWLEHPNAEFATALGEQKTGVGARIREEQRNTGKDCGVNYWPCSAQHPSQDLIGWDEEVQPGPQSEPISGSSLLDNWDDPHITETMAPVWPIYSNELDTPEEYRGYPPEWGEDVEDFEWGTQSWTAPDFFTDARETCDVGMKVVGFIPEEPPTDEVWQNYTRYTNQRLADIVDDEMRTGQMKERYDPREFAQWLPSKGPKGPRLVFPDQDDYPGGPAC